MLDLREFKVDPRPKNTIFGSVLSTMLVVLKRPEIQPVFVFQTGKPNKTTFYQKRKSNKTYTNFLICYRNVPLMQKHQFFRKKKRKFACFSLFCKMCCDDNELLLRND